MACRGTGRLVSQLGGTESAVTCPWCEGSGLRPAEIDAQAHWGDRGAAGSAGEGSEGQPAPAGGEAPGEGSEPAGGDGPNADDDPPSAA
jgi:hypothetical protein